MKNWIKKKLLSFLGIDKLEEKYTMLSDELEEMYKELLIVRTEMKFMRSDNEEIIRMNKNLMRQFNLSADIYPKENISWAVISIQGKNDYVKFVNLSDKDMQSIHEYLKQFDGTNRTIDTPMGIFKDL